jgi:hypothetical protein
MVRAIDTFLAAGMLLLIGLVGAPWVLDRSGLFEPQPYTDVTLLRADHEGDTLHVVAGYTRADDSCEYVNAVAIGIAFGEATALEWTPYRGPNVTEVREPGRQKLDWDIRVNGGVFDTVEIRTRHFCDGERVDRTMLVIDMNEVN